jgi:hypothetical protein
MSSKPSTSAISKSQASSNHGTGEIAVGSTARDEQIRRRAYEIYLERGAQPGRELDDWLQAEHEREPALVLRAQAG